MHGSTPCFPLWALPPHGCTKTTALPPNEVTTWSSTPLWHTPHPYAHGRPHLRLLHAHAPNGRIGRSRGSRGTDWRHHRQQHLEPRPPQKHDHHDLMLAGISSAFGAVFGSPLAGAFFGMEMCFIGKIDYTAGIYCLVASFTGYFTSLAWEPSTRRMSSPAFPT